MRSISSHKSETLQIFFSWKTQFASYRVQSDAINVHVSWQSDNDIHIGVLGLHYVCILEVSVTNAGQRIVALSASTGRELEPTNARVNLGIDSVNGAWIKFHLFHLKQKSILKMRELLRHAPVIKKYVFLPIKPYHQLMIMAIGLFLIFCRQVNYVRSSYK